MMISSEPGDDEAVVDTLTLREDIAKVVTELPDGARRLRIALQASDGRSTLDSLKKATAAIDRTASEAAGGSTAPRGVVRVQVEEPGRGFLVGVTLSAQPMARVLHYVPPRDQTVA